MTTRTQQIKKDLQCYGVDPFQIAAEAIDRGDRLALQVTRLEKILHQIKFDPAIVSLALSIILL